MYTIKKIGKKEYRLADESGTIQDGDLNSVLKSIRDYEADSNYFEDPLEGELEESGLEELDFDPK